MKTTFTKNPTSKTMKTLSTLFSALCYCLLLFGTAMQAQNITVNPNIYSNPAILTNPGIVGICTKPDLHITAFAVQSITPGAIVGTGATATRYFSINFRATVKNSGQSASITCNLMPEYSRFNQNTFFFGGCQIFAPLNAGASRVVEGNMTIRIPVSHTQAKLRLFIDAPCAEEFLPAYVKVNECNENNNYSPIITATLSGI